MRMLERENKDVGSVDYDPEQQLIVVSTDSSSIVNMITASAQHFATRTGMPEAEIAFDEEQSTWTISGISQAQWLVIQSTMLTNFGIFFKPEPEDNVQGEG